jgi:hypothetical protein
MNGALPAFLFGVYIVHDRFPLQPQHWRLRSFLADLLGGAALWAVSADAGKRVVSLSPQRRHFPAGCAVWILGSRWR